MRYLLPALLAFSSALHAAEESEAGKPKKLPAVSVLPDGSELQGVLIPRHNENFELVSSLRAKLITLVNDEMIEGKKVLVDFYNPDGSKRAHIDLAKCSFNQDQGMLSSSDPVTIESDKFRAKGSGIHYAFQQGEGFLTGPAITWITPPSEETSMNTRPSLISAASIALLSQISVAAPENDIDAKTAHAEATKVTRTTLSEDLEKSKAAIEQTKAFLVQAEIANQEGAAPELPEAKPLNIQPDPKDTVISCDGGMYFDADKGVFVYLKNVRVKDPRFELTGANELKIFLSQKPEKKKKDPKNPDEDQKDKKDEKDKKDPEKKSEGLDIGSKFGEVERIIATGAVRLVQTEVEKGKQPIEASGAIFTYHPSTGEIVLSGGYPWVKQGTTFMRAQEPNLILRIQKSGSFDTEGKWDVGGRLNQD